MQSHLVCQQETDGLQALLAPVYVVAEKEIVGLWRKPAILKQAEQVRVLTVDVAWGCTSAPTQLLPRARTANLDGRLELEQVGLCEENLLGCDAQHAYFVLRQLDLLSGLLLAHFQQSIDNIIKKCFLLSNKDRLQRDGTQGCNSTSGHGIP